MRRFGLLGLGWTLACAGFPGKDVGLPGKDGAGKEAAGKEAAGKEAAGKEAAPVSATPAPPVATVPPPAATPAPAPSNEALLKAGLCTTAVLSVVSTPLADGRSLLQVQCGAEAFEFAWADRLSPLLVVDGGPVHAGGVPTVDTDGTITWVERGSSGCEGVRYRVKGQQLELVSRKRQACGAAVATTGSPAPSATSSGACLPTETVYFACSARAKTIAVCGKDGGVQYRFGPRGNPELAFPTTPDAKAFHLEERRAAQALAQVLTFTNEGVRYEVTESMGSGAGPMAESNNFVGVTVLKADKVIASVRCTGPVQSDWTALAGVAGK